MNAITNRTAWLQIAAALDKHPQRDLFNHARSVAAPSAINFGGCVAPYTASVPDGNHGDNFDEVSA